ncbi:MULTISPECIES: RNA polymerase sigma factor [unclassified Cryobacterium]|uniref:RNA polymerase sigma factor n=1 Tax=unclassified Cryobacterium TaxID=2649013 RepID=UPI00106A03AD|nr:MULTISPECIES: RNA polymerase sigma factor [unclassified Cryobacterium]TFC53702.1 RNA polymerase sigma factor [Cryobacterium sp. TMB3-1-2]TFC75121.1 RNA polymerase sigma factor [Cryobacterium sp. TMB3-15]TFC75257.1 RNA polymerase sigma factor [Cryobacterium sp. TMB3-10]TFD41534.1 RNA polymerase sigma factor [Cryobacterium sp. TMB3-12]
MADPRRTVDAVWRIEGARIVATLAKMTNDVVLAEDLAQEAVVDALRQWPEAGIPRNPGAWLTAVAKRKAIDTWRRRERLDERYRAMAHDLVGIGTAADAGEPIDDDVLRLVFIACHPVLAREAQVALTLRLIGGLTTEEIARLFLVPVATIQQRILRAKKTLAAAGVPFEVPDPSEWRSRLGAVLGVVYLIFTEGYAATSGDHWLRADLANEALRLARVLAGLTPREPEAHALVALMELQASRFGARVRADGTPILLADQDRRRWDHGQIARGQAALARADALGRSRGSYALQAAIAQCHARAPSVADTDWDRIVLLYEALGRIAPNPVVELNRAVAVAMATGPASALRIVDDLADDGALRGSALLPSVRGELLARLGRAQEARAEFLTAAALTANTRERDVLLAKADAQG